MEELRLEVVINPKLEQGVRDAIAFGDFVLTDDNQVGVVYPDVGGLPRFFTDLILGRAFPLTLVMRNVNSVSRIVAVALFLHRDLAIHSKMPGVVTAASLTDQYEHAGMAHIDRDLARFFELLIEYLPPNLRHKDQQTRLTTTVGWIREYVLEDRLPALPVISAEPRVIDQGTNGFVLAEISSRQLLGGWVELFRQGYLRGMLVSTPRKDRRSVLVTRKSTFVSFDLQHAATIFNEAEQAMGEPSGWVADDLWLWGPDEGTLLPISTLLDVLVRV